MITIGEVSLLFILRSRKITAILTKVALISKYATMEKLTCWPPWKMIWMLLMISPTVTAIMIAPFTTTNKDSICW